MFLKLQNTNVRINFFLTRLKITSELNQISQQCMCIVKRSIGGEAFF